MPTILGVILSSLGKALLRTLLAASTQKMMERMVIMALEHLAAKSTSPVDDELVAQIKKALSEEMK